MYSSELRTSRISAAALVTLWPSASRRRLQVRSLRPPFSPFWEKGATCEQQFVKATRRIAKGNLFGPRLGLH